jgi:outer membrane cobalamin receptor
LLGLDARHVDGDVENRITGERPQVQGTTDVSGYGQLTLRPLDALAFVVGARALYSTTWGATYLFKAGARWDIYEGLYARTRLTRNFRQPTLRELYLPFPTANPDLRPEHSLNWDFGVGYESGYVEASCTVYRTAADDLIRYFGAWPTAEVVNIDHLTVWGVEGRVALKDLGPVSLRVAAGWQDVGRYTRQNPEAKLDFAVDVGEEFGAHFIGGSLSGEWVHGLYMANYGRQPIADVFAMDLAVRYRYSLPSRAMTLEPYLFLRNFLDRTYAYVDGYPMPGFNLLLGLKVGL